MQHPSRLRIGLKHSHNLAGIVVHDHLSALGRSRDLGDCFSGSILDMHVPAVFANRHGGPALAVRREQVEPSAIGPGTQPNAHAAVGVLEQDAPLLFHAGQHSNGLPRQIECRHCAATLPGVDRCHPFILFAKNQHLATTLARRHQRARMQ